MSPKPPWPAIFNGATTFGKGVADSNLLTAKADLMKIQSSLTLEQENGKIAMDEIQASIENFNGVHTKTRKAIETIMNSNIELSRQV